MQDAMEGIRPAAPAGRAAVAWSIIVICSCLCLFPLQAMADKDEGEPDKIPSIVSILPEQWTKVNREALGIHLFSMDKGLILEGTPIPLDLQTAVRLALKGNLDLRAEGYTVRIAASEIKKAEGAFDTYLVSSFSHNTSRTPISSNIQSENAAYLRANTTYADVGFRKMIQTGSVLELKLDLNRLSSNSTWLTLNPYYTSHLNFSIAQPLLKNGGLEFQKAPIRIAQNLHLMSEERWKAFVTDTLVSVIQAYWDLVFAYQNVEVRQISLALTRELLRSSEVQVRIGSLAPVDLLQSRTGVALREEELITAKSILEAAMDLMKGLIHLEEAPVYSTVHILPTDTPPTPPAEEDMVLEDTIRLALKSRPEYMAARKDLETKNLKIKLAQNQLLPKLDITGKVGLNGLGGDTLPVDELAPWEAFLYDLFNIPTPSESPWVGNINKSFDELLSEESYQWSVGLRFEMPLENNSAKANYRQAKMDAYKSLWTLRSLEQKIIFEVKETWRSLRVNRQKILTSEATQKLANQQLEAEQKRLSLGLSTNYQVLKMEEDFRNAQINALLAMAEYWKAKVRLQKATGVLLEKTGVPVEQISLLGRD